jgi:phospholipid/cholesterol/gamma-HCH transport system substrate-binding protein
MRSRIVREGSLGLLLLAGFGVFVASVGWLKGLNPGNRSYVVTVNFPTVAGVQNGSSVRYRGVPVGRITSIQTATNGVAVKIAISPGDLIIPSDVEASIDQSGLLGENVVNLSPRNQEVPNVAVKPLDKDCDRTVILCNDSQINGGLGISTDALVKSSIRFADTYGRPEFYNNINTLTANSGKAAAEIALMSREFGVLARALRQEIGVLSGTASSIGGAASALGGAAVQVGGTAGRASVTLDQVNGLLAENRTTLVYTLNNISETSDSLKGAVNQLGPTLDRFQRSRLLNDLETLSANAAVASQNLKDASASLNNPSNVATLQQTLDAARATFQNAQKITSDLDELTGDPAVREQFKNVIKGFSGLLSSTQQLEQQAQYAQQLQPAAEVLAAQRELAALRSQLAAQGKPNVAHQTAPNQIVPSPAGGLANSPAPQVSYQPPAAAKPVAKP